MGSDRLTLRMERERERELGRMRYLYSGPLTMKPHEYTSAEEEEEEEALQTCVERSLIDAEPVAISLEPRSGRVGQYPQSVSTSHN